MTKEEILIAAEKMFKQFEQACNGIDEKLFFEWPDGKWSVADNMQHLVLSTGTTTLAYKLPRFLVRWVGGKPNRTSRSFDEVLAKYNKKLADGGKTSARYVPVRYAPRSGEMKLRKEILLARWNKVTSAFIAAVKNKRTEEDLDNYLARHPLLGKITLRELCYFTIFHTEHHLTSINKRTQSLQ